MSDDLTLRTHVGRNLLHTAALFKTDKAVVWEYVSNGLDYVDDGTMPRVYVHLDPESKSITITDNGRGMNWGDLGNYFLMHGENVDRKAGRPKRGLFGTGKSAAFGIAETLRITTVRSGQRSIVELKRSQIKEMKSGDPVPIRTIEKEVPTEEQNGTRVEIDKVRLRKLDQAGIIRFIQQHLAQMAPNSRVYVNLHECEYREPAAIEVKTFTPSEPEKEFLGDVTLTIKIAGAPLDEYERGIAVTGNGVLFERTLAGLETKDFTQYLFGNLDVPRLDIESENAEIPPVDMSRSMTLNPENPLVARIYAFIGPRLEEVRAALADNERKRRATEDARKLEKEARAIARAINDDFFEFREKVATIVARSKGNVDRQKLSNEEPGSQLIPGGPVPASETDEPGGVGSEGGSRSGGSEPRTLGLQLEKSEPGERSGTPVEAGLKGKSSRGGFQVQFKSMGEPEVRAKYVSQIRTIYVNLDHPQLVAAKGPGTDESRLFRLLSYEIAFSEYAIALASELNSEGEYIDPSDAIFDIRATVNRLARRAASLFS